MIQLIINRRGEACRTSYPGVGDAVVDVMEALQKGPVITGLNASGLRFCFAPGHLDDNSDLYCGDEGDMQRLLQICALYILRRHHPREKLLRNRANTLLGNREAEVKPALETQDDEEFFKRVVLFIMKCSVTSERLRLPLDDLTMAAGLAIGDGVSLVERLTLESV